MQHSKWGLFLLALSPGMVYASQAAEHSDPVAFVILGVTAVFFFAIIGRYIAKLLHQPGVLGELLMGVVIGNLWYYFGSDLIIVLREGSAIYPVMKALLSGVSLHDAVQSSISNPYYAAQVIQVLSGQYGIEYLKIAYTIDIFSRYGVIFLLFIVGLECSVEELKHTGRESVLVAVIGMLAPMFLGFGVAYFLMPTASYESNLFVAATLSATSIGITARVLSEKNKLRTREAKTILGAAMLDDILGLILLALVSSIVISGTINVIGALGIIACALIFFTLTLWLGPIILRMAVKSFRFFEPWEAKLFIAFLFVMSLAWLASYFHLAAIVGAFAAGVILHDGYFKSSITSQKEIRSINHLIAPLESILAPIFFIVIGMQVKLETFYNWNVITVAIGLIIAAILGKLLSGLGANRKDDRVLIGIGMLPRGEVGLVFASIGRTLGVISDDLFSAIVLMVMITTFIAPPLLEARYAYQRKLKHEN